MRYGNGRVVYKRRRHIQGYGSTVDVCERQQTQAYPTDDSIGHGRLTYLWRKQLDQGIHQPYQRKVFYQ